MLAGVLELQILAGIGKLSDDMKRAERVVQDSTSAMGKSVTSLQNQFSKLGMGLSLGLVIDQVRRFSDEFTKVTAQMRIATATQAEYAKGMEDVRRISTTAQAGITATTMLYTRLTNSLKQHGATQQDVGRITESVSLGLKAYGATTAEAASAMLQLSQAFGSGRLGGEEFRAVSEAMPNMMQSLANSMGVPKSALRDLSMQGKITSEVMMKAWNDPALIAGLQKQAEMTRTITGELTVFRNNMTMLVGEFMGASGSTSGITTAIRAMSDAVILLSENLKTIITLTTILGIAYAGKYAVGLAMSIEKTIALADATAMNAAINLRASQQEAALAAAKVATASATAASTVSLLRNTIVTVEANTATLAKTVADNAATIAQLNHARSVAQLSGHYYIIRQVEAELVVTTQALAVAQTELNASTARQARLQATLIAEDRAALKSRADLVKANAAVIASQNAATASTLGNLAAIGAAIRTAVMAHPIIAATTAIAAIVVAISNWDAVVKSSKASLKWFQDDFLGGMEFLAARVGISLGELVQKLSLLATVTVPQLKSGEFKKQWDELGKLAEQSRIEAAARIAGLDKKTVDHEAAAAAQQLYADKEAWNKLHLNKKQNRDLELAELDTQYIKLASTRNADQEFELKLANDYLSKRKVIEDAYNKEAITAAGNAHTSKMEQMAVQMAAETSAEKEHLTNSQKVSIAWAELKHKEQTTQEALNYAKAQGIAIALDEKVAQAELQKQLDSGQVAYAKYWSEVATTTEKLKEHNDNMAFENSLIGQTKEQIVALTKLREDEALVKAQSNLETMITVGKAIPAEISAQKELIAQLQRTKDLREGKASAEAAKAANDIIKADNKKLWDDINGFAHDAFNNIFDKGKNAFEEIGKVIKKSILDMLYKMTVQKWIFNIAGVSGGVAGAGMAGATDMFGGGSGGGGIGGLLNAGQSLWSAFSGGMASGMGSVMTTAGEMLGSTALTEMGWGATAAAQGANVVGGFAGMGASIASTIPWIAGGMAVLSLLGSFSSSSTSITGSGLNIAGKVGAPKTSGYTTGVTNESSWWGLNSSSSSWRTGSAASKETSLAITNMFAQIRSAIVLSGAAIGKDATALDNQIANYTISIGDLSLAGMDAAKQQEAITKAVSGMADSMVAQLVPGMEKFQQANETLLQTLVRVATEVMTLNGFYLSLGVTTRATTDSADKLSLALGGVTQASALMTSFVAGFAPEAQKTALALGTLKSAGLPMAEFLTTTQSWWNFAKVASAEQLTAILKNQDVIKSWVAAMDTSSKAVQDNITALQNKAIADYKAARAATDSLRAFALSVRELQRSLWAGSQTPLSSTYGVTRSQFAAINASAAGGDTNAQGNLAGAATAFLDASKKQAMSAIEYARDFAMVQNALSDTAFKTEVVVTVAEAQLTVMELIHQAIVEGNDQSYAALLSVQNEINLAKLAGTLDVDTLRGTVTATTDKQISAVDTMNQSVLRITDPSGGLITAQIEVQKAIDAAKVTGSIDIANLSGIVSAETLKQILAVNGVSGTISSETLKQVAASQQIKTEVITNAGYTAKVTDMLNTGTNPILDSMGAWLNSINTQSSIQTQSLQYLLQASISASEAARMAVVEQAITKLSTDIAAAVGTGYSASNLSRSTGAAGDTALSYAGAYKTISGSVSATGAASTLSKTVSAAQQAAVETKNRMEMLNAQRASAQVEIDRAKSIAAPSTYINGQTSDAAWELVLSRFNASHQSLYGIPMNRPWGADVDAASAYSALVDQYRSIAVAQAQSVYDAIPAFAVGTNEVPFDMTARIHAGEEIKPVAYVDKDKRAREQTNELLARLQTEVSMLRKENQAGQIAIERNTKKTAVILDKFDGEGMPAVRAA